MNSADHNPILSDKRFYGIFTILSVLTLLPLWWYRIIPMQDIWQHLALVDIIHNYNAPGSVYPEYFILPSTPKPNLLYYYLTHWIGLLTGSLEIANKMVLSLYVLGLPWAYLFFLRSFDRSKWLALFSFPFVYSAMFSYGFAAFVLATPMFFLAVGAYRRFICSDEDAPPYHWGIMASAILLLIFFTHAHVFLLTGFVCGLLFLMHRKGPWRMLLNLAPFAPALAFFLPWFVVYFIEGTPSSSGMHFGKITELFGGRFYKPSQVLNSFFFYLGDYFRREADDALFLLLMLTALILLIVRPAPQFPKDSKQKLKYVDLEIITVLLAITVIIFPQHIKAQAIVSMRHLGFTLLCFFGWLGFDGVIKRITVPAVIVLIALHLGGLGNIFHGFHRFQKEMDNYPSLFEHVEPGKRLLKITYNQESKVVNHGAYWHMHFFYTLTKGGISDIRFAEYPHNPIQYKPDMVPPSPDPEFYHTPGWRYFEYVLTRKSSKPALEKVEKELELVSEVNDWVLYRTVSWPKPREGEFATIAKSRKDMFN
ncbi:MAG TPA: hypothetical protein PLC97_02775 [Myxococcota bacterium]|jgi:hypothetical protein|nr:hypothetical protein [Myxococcota bacterium]OQC41584.1 MAG: hypothetical protein BWX66_00693 [Deltaproteobacteria bacterium ADurb.Bin058]HQC44142.1 hypothetical protein [Myxococcota bacterium]HQL57290.1 hypothetical protein [Myxococcota bacterium]